jgi:hypothetical protein
LLQSNSEEIEQISFVQHLPQSTRLQRPEDGKEF